jgi:hypothetical protein
MDLTTVLVTVFCLVDDWLAGQGQRLRRRGPTPTLADSEVLTIECVGEFLGIDTDKGLYEHFRRHWADWFPALGRVHRTSFVRQAANLWAVKQRLYQHLLGQVRFDPAVSLVDSVAIPICRFARAYRCRRLRELAAWGHDEVAKQTYLGLRAHLRVCWPGVIVAGRLAPANVSDLAVGEELLAGVAGWVLPRPQLRQLAAGRATGRPGCLAACSTPRRATPAAAAAAVAGRQAPPDRDRDRPADRPLPPQAGLGPRRLAPVVTVAAQAAQPHHGGAAVPAGGTAAPTLRAAHHRIARTPG